MNRATIALTAAALFVGCATQQPPPPTAPLVPAALTPPPPPPVVRIPPDPLDALSHAVRHAYLTGSTEPIHDGITIILPYSANARPIIQTCPLHVTEIALADDEHLVNASIGDSDRFVIDARGNHIIVKPTPPGHQASGSSGAIAGTVMVPLNYSTNLIAETDKRTYHFIIQSTPHRWTEMVTFFYPDDITAARVRRAAAIREAARQTLQQVASTSPDDQLNFGYRISGPDVAWRPVQVFSDRSHTYIRFNDAAAEAGDLPALFTGTGKQQVAVNYAVHGSTFVADRVVTDGALVEGSGVGRVVIRITQD